MLPVATIALTVALNVTAPDGEPVPSAVDGPYAAIITKVAEAQPNREYALVRRQLRFWRPSGDGRDLWEVEFEEDHRPDVLSALEESLRVLGVCQPPPRARSCEEFRSAPTLALSLPRRVEGNVWQVSVLTRDPGERGFAAQHVYTLAEEGGVWRITRTELIAVT
jgi:hypothetical protein